MSLPRYAEGEIGTVLELMEEMHRHFDKRRFPEGPDGPEVSESQMTPTVSTAGGHAWGMDPASDWPQLLHQQRDKTYGELPEELSGRIECSTQADQDDGHELD